MSNEPAFMKSVQWEAFDGVPDESSDLPYATHRGVLRIGNSQIECFRLSDGRAIFEAKSFEDFCEAWFGGPIIEGR